MLDVKGAGGGSMQRRACWTREIAKAATKPHSGGLGRPVIALYDRCCGRRPT
jgi:hypothetical protein